MRARSGAAVELLRAKVEKIMKKHFHKAAVGVGLASAAGAASAVSIVDYASLGTAVSGELTAGIAAALATVGIIWGARIGLRFVRSMMK